MAKAGKGMGHDTVRGVEHVEDVPENVTREDELASKRMGDNELQGDDQVRVHNQRQTQAGARTDRPETDDFVDKHKTGLRSDKVAPSEEELDKEMRKS
ncbi:hypothetical protein [Salinarimonas ramus]|uniref:Uncharacterized protein n=1 Tax=Salinarimonas ramus TaxID=690164 RepID=A0A917Q7Q1_9HYPH|nr:hypothetical protein [Salinarimonas ramus]GGK28645.1 hypothetical protein GCM10011322_13860 [Salinarimonas ramus]